MCLIFFAIHQHPIYKLVVAGNRDEFYDRPTARADFWEDHPEILGGRDLQAGGTWLGVSKSGKIGFITNYRDPQHIKPNAPSRGFLVSDFLLSNQAAESYVEDIDSKQYNGFNLLVGTPNELCYLSNYSKDVRKLTKGIFGLSNHLLDTPWPKVSKGKEAFTTALNKEKVAPDELLDLLYDDVPADDKCMPNTGVELEFERKLSSMFIKTPNYGSRSSTVVLVNDKDELLLQERAYSPENFQYSTQQFQFKIRE